MNSKKDVKLSAMDEIFASKPHIAEKIAKNLPMKFRMDVLGSVCKGFYDAVCNVDKTKYKMVIDGKKYDYKLLQENILTSIINSNRVFNEILLSKCVLEAQLLNQLLKIALKHGASVKRLQMWHCSIQFKQNCFRFRRFLEKLPNLEVLDCSGLFNNDRTHGRFPSFSPLNFEPFLHKLKKFNMPWLKCSYSNQFILQFIASDSLERLSIHDDGLINFHDFLQRQSNLKSLHFGKGMCAATSGYSSKLFDAKHYKHLTLKAVGIHFHFYFYITKGSNEFLQQMVRDHPLLEKIHFNRLDLDDTTIVGICHYGHQLQSLTCEMTNDNCIALLGIVHLKQLKELEFEFKSAFSQYEVFVEFSQLNMPSVKKMKLRLDWTGSQYFNCAVENFGQHWTNVEELDYHEINHSTTNATINKILLNFAMLKTFICFNLKCNNNFITHSKLENFVIGLIDGDALLSALNAFPNMTSIYFNYGHTHFYCYGAELSTVIQRLTDHENLRKLRIDFNCHFESDQLESFKQLCGKIKEFSFVFQGKIESLNKLADDFSGREIYSMEYIKCDDTWGRIRLKNHKY